ncbi:MAG: DNA methylase [Elusimicrobia bacterium]|nr:DNA methylase [Candidatus Liberimonas magnetica]
MQQTLFNMDIKTIDDISNPEAYKGLYSFHKYWGKKPTESIVYFIQNYTNETDIVLDPFLGSGLISKECLARNRRFIGIDLNPVSVEHANFILDLPKSDLYLSAIKEIESRVKEKINLSYLLKDGKIASHYLWHNNNLMKVWIKPKTGRSRVEFEPNQYDLNLITSFSDYNIRNIRNATFFTNSRINSKSTMSITDLFTKRALRNIDLIIDEIQKYPTSLQRALFLTLTSSSGQMSSMVFAITGRGKTKNKHSDKIEVGSWVVGFWRPKLHFEINVWNCFESRANKLYKALIETNIETYPVFSSITKLLNADIGASIINSNCLDTMRLLPDKSIKLICTDPPHSDRIPYLELSEMWNSILNKKVVFEKEIIVSNAKERNKNKSHYVEDMKALIKESSRILKVDGLFLLYYNARDKKSWEFMEILAGTSDLVFAGAFPMEYSANSVIQDNRKGGMKTDYVLMMKHKDSKILENHELDKIPGWILTIPKIKDVALS